MIMLAHRPLSAAFVHFTAVTLKFLSTFCSCYESPFGISVSVTAIDSKSGKG